MPVWVLYICLSVNGSLGKINWNGAWYVIIIIWLGKIILQGVRFESATEKFNMKNIDFFSHKVQTNINISRWNRSVSSYTHIYVTYDPSDSDYELEHCNMANL